MVKNKEIFAVGDGDLVQDEAPFGYQERHAEYRYKPSIIAGKFRSNTPGGALDTWHLAQDFASLPVLDSSFIEEDPPMSRILVVTTEPAFLLDAWFTLKTARPMPTYAVPGLVDHF